MQVLRSALSQYRSFKILGYIFFSPCVKQELLVASHRGNGSKVLQCCAAADHYPSLASLKKHVVSRTAGLQDWYFVISVCRIVISFTCDKTGVTGLEGTGEMVTAEK